MDANDNQPFAHDDHSSESDAQPAGPAAAADPFTGWQETGFRGEPETQYGATPYGAAPVGAASGWVSSPPPGSGSLPHDGAWPASPLPGGAQASASTKRPRARTGLVLAAALLISGATGAGATAAVLNNRSGTASSAVSAASGTGTGAGIGTGSSTSSGSGSSLPVLPGGYRRNDYGYDSNSGFPGTSSSVAASATQSVGVVDIDTVDGYQGAEAAGTGMIVTSSGEILTNNHVIDGATSISVTVVTTGKTYTAKVVGTSPTSDIAVLQLVNASGLKTANFGTSSSVGISDPVTGVGNAGGVGGTPSAARGTVTALNRTITASSDDGSGAETLHNMIVTNAPIASGDSGGPLYNASNTIVGIDTAAGNAGNGTTRGYAIPINRALSIAAKIEAGDASATIHIGYPAFLGVSLSSQSTQPVIAKAYAGGASARAGLAAGDTITAVDGVAVRTYTQLHTAIAKHRAGDTVRITYRTSAGTSRTATVTLRTGPAD